MARFLVLAAGVALLVLTGWARTAPRPDGLRWWTTDRWNRTAVLLFFPGLGLCLVAVWAMMTLAAEDSVDGADAWLVLFLGPGAVGVIMVLWGMFLLPIPRWVLPRWLRQQDDARPGARRRGRKA